MNNKVQIVWTEYLKYRASLRGYKIEIIEEILRHSTERYIDASTGRNVVVGKCTNHLLIIPYESGENRITPITVHSTTRQQIKFRLKTGRFTYG